MLNKKVKEYLRALEKRMLKRSNACKKIINNYENSPEFKIATDIETLLQLTSVKWSTEDTAELIAFLARPQKPIKEINSRRYKKIGLAEQIHGPCDGVNIEVTEEHLDHWQKRLQTCQHDFFKSRYGDMVIVYTKYLTKKSVGSRYFEIVIEANIRLCKRKSLDYWTSLRLIERAYEFAIYINRLDLILASKKQMFVMLRENMESAYPRRWNEAFKMLFRDCSSKYVDDNDKKILVQIIETKLQKTCVT